MELEISWEIDVPEKEQEELTKFLKEAVYEALLSGGGPEDAEIGLVLVDDETIRLLNKSYRGIDQPTDVLSFALQEKGEGEPEIYYEDFWEKGDAEQQADFSSVEEIREEELSQKEETEEDDDLPALNITENFLEYEDSVLGDIVISVERARVQAEEFGHSFAREIVYLAVHGTFHLLGYDHEEEEEASIMRRMEERVMEKIGLSR
ncbi:MAG TPA: rRNA maturation RNase YbeY [Peptococcaceae bacterium]|nr:rRNA maturation RNase YbeY [Peptococcaceae bacterium]